MEYTVTVKRKRRGLRKWQRERDTNRGYVGGKLLEIEFMGKSNRWRYRMW